MTSLTLLLVCLVTLTQAIPDKQYDLNDAERHFEEFIQTYGKKYANDEEKATRFEIFKASLTDINRRNLKEELAEFGITEFADLTLEELIKYRGGYRKANYNLHCTSHTSVPDVKAPESWDWNKEGAVTSVQQQKCGDSYAFSAVGNIEGQHKISTGKLVEFSVQQILNCDALNYHCEGGQMQNAFISLIYMGGSVRAKYGQYRGVQMNCMLVGDPLRANITGCDMYQNITEDDLLKLLYKRGPLSIAIDGNSVYAYKNGVLVDCDAVMASHSVLLVGYGTDHGVPYWLIKNSWGPRWGENGYFRVKRGINACGLPGYEISSSIIS